MPTQNILWAPDVSITISTTAGSATSAAVWNEWIRVYIDNSTTTYAISTNSAVTWGQWNHGYITTNGIPGSTYERVVGARHMATAAEISAHAATERERQIRNAALAETHRQDRAVAAQRAEELLMEMLNDEQRKSYRDGGSFYVEARSGQLYRIEKGRQGNVYAVDRTTREWTERLCIHQQENVPNGDVMLMQKLLIETAEEQFREVANITSRRGGVLYGRGLLDAGRLVGQA